MKRLIAFAAALSATTALATTGHGAGFEHHEPADTETAAKPDDGKAKEAAAMGEALRLADIWLETERAYENIPAMSVAVVKGQDTLWAKGFGHTDRARKRAATADTIYSICSISKLFTAVAFMQEWEKGTVRLDEPVATYLPWASLAPDDRDSVP